MEVCDTCGGKSDVKHEDEAIGIVPAQESITVVVEDNVNVVRPFITCFIVRDIDLTGATFRQFIQAQTRLHNSVCGRRKKATIGTHDLDKIPKGTVTYTAKPPDQLKIIPLGLTREVSAQNLCDHLRAEARLAKKRLNRMSGLHPYLKLLGHLDEYPCLVDQTGRVISFPPITNAEGTKLSEDTKNIFVEITSGDSLERAKLVADAVIHEMIAMDIFERDSVKLLQVDRDKIVDPKKNVEGVNSPTPTK